MPEAVQYLMLLAPTTHFVSLGQAILYRSAGMAVVWPSFLILFAIAGVLFCASLPLSRRSVAQMG